MILLTVKYFVMLSEAASVAVAVAVAVSVAVAVLAWVLGLMDGYVDCECKIVTISFHSMSRDIAVSSNTLNLPSPL